MINSFVIFKLFWIERVTWSTTPDGPPIERSTEVTGDDSRAKTLRSTVKTRVTIQRLALSTRYIQDVYSENDGCMFFSIHVLLRGAQYVAIYI